jgi:hypothetical protein
MNFDVCGPFEIPRNPGKTLIDKKLLPDLKAEIEKLNHGLTDACGCYVFAIRAAKGYKPWYVGQTKMQKLFWESFADSKINLYNEVINARNGVPVITFIPTLTKGGAKYRKPNKQIISIDFLEKWLIGEAFQKNQHLLNIQHTKFLKDLHVTGIFNAKQGEAHKPSRELRRIIW